MKKLSDLKGFYFITDSNLSVNGIVDDVKRAVACGVKIIQYREKNLPTGKMIEEARLLSSICRGKALFIVNDRVDVALACDADGVHLGQDDMDVDTARKILGKDKIIGLTVHSVDEALSCSSADYLGVSPIFATTTKKDAGKPAGVKLVYDIKKISKLPIAAIGGINLNNAKQVIEAGADCICAISATVGKSDMEEEIRKFQELFEDIG